MLFVESLDNTQQQGIISAMKCPNCGNDINIGAIIGSQTSKAKAAAARRNAKLGGWPKGKKRGKRKERPADANAPGKP